MRKSPALFGLAHLAWIHSALAFVVGVYLGWLTAQIGSVAPAIAAHALNNVVWTVATWAGLGSNLPRGAHAALLLAYVVCAVASVAWLRPRLSASAASNFAVSSHRHGA